MIKIMIMKLMLLKSIGYGLNVNRNFEKINVTIIYAVDDLTIIFLLVKGCISWI